MIKWMMMGLIFLMNSRLHRKYSTQKKNHSMSDFFFKIPSQTGLLIFRVHNVKHLHFQFCQEHLR